MLPLAFKSHLRVERIGDAVYVLGEEERHALTGRAYARLAPLLIAATYDEDALLAALSAEIRPAALRLAVASLRARGLIAEVARDHGSPEAAFRGAAGLDERATDAVLERERLRVHAIGEASAEATVEALREVFPRTTLGAAGDATMHVRVVDDYLAPELAAWNAEALGAKVPWTLIQPRGARAWIGPVFRPGASACWECLAFVLRGHRRVEREIAQRNGAAPRAPASLASTQRMAASMLATELAKAAWGAASAPLLDHVITIDAVGATIEKHRVVRRERCSACGEGATQIAAHAAPTFAPSAEQTVRRFAHLVSPVTGIVGRLSRMSPEDDPLLHVYYATYARSSRAPAGGAIGPLEDAAAGRGRTDAEARASALCEALERYSGVFQGHEPRRRGSLRELGDRAIAPNSLLSFSETQTHDREAWNRAHSHHHRVPAPLNPDEPIEWCAVSSLTSSVERWVPASYAYYDYVDREAAYACGADSNGCAAGASRDEAVLHGLLELVERDAVALWWYNRVARPPVDLAALNEPYFAEVAAHTRARGRDLWVLDLTSDLGVPVYAAITGASSGAAEDIALGFGAHLEPRVAALRAVTEAIQVMHSRGGPGTELGAWRRSATRANQPYLVASTDGSAAREPARVAPSGDAAEDVRRVAQALAGAGIEAFVLDQTRPEVGLPVVKVIAPGLRHFWARLGKGRLYDVPVRLGWLPTPRREDEMNPIGFFA